MTDSAAAKLPADNAPHLLVVDDDSRLRSLLKRFLGENGFRITVAESAADARAKIEGLEFDLLVLDVMMPGESGIEFADALRAAKSDIPILMLTARSEIEHRILGLEAGADDYLAKPFEPRELLLRINAILRRQVKPEDPASAEIRFGPFTFHIGRGELYRGKKQIRLTDRERELLTIFAGRPGETVPRLELAGDDGATSERTIDVQINRLRRKIEADSANPAFLQTVRGIGYRLIAD